MSATVWIVLDPLDLVTTRIESCKVDRSYPPFVPATTMSNRDATIMITPSPSATLFRERERQMGTTFPQMIVDRSPQMA